MFLDYISDYYNSRNNLNMPPTEKQVFKAIQKLFINSVKFPLNPQTNKPLILKVFIGKLVKKRGIKLLAVTVELYKNHLHIVCQTMGKLYPAGEFFHDDPYPASYQKEYVTIFTFSYMGNLAT